MDAQSKRITLTTALVAILSAFAVSAQAAEIKVLSDGPIKPALTKVADLFRHERRVGPVRRSVQPRTDAERAFESSLRLPQLRVPRIEPVKRVVRL